jgi:hypothetical protein
LLRWDSSKPVSADRTNSFAMPTAGDDHSCACRPRHLTNSAASVAKDIGLTVDELLKHR